MDLTTFEGLHPSLDRERRLVVLELDHGKANEVGTLQLDAFEALCEGLEQDASVSCLCTTSRRTSKRGTPIFIAGANVTERSGWDYAKVRDHVQRQRTIMQRLRRLPVFNIVLSTGVTLGWGTEYLLTGDYTIATEGASFGLPETGLGIVPGAGGTAELATLIGPSQALRMGCTGETIGAEEAHWIGLVGEVVQDLDAGLERVRALAEQVARRSPTAMVAFKRALLDGLGAPEHERLELEGRAYAHTLVTGEAAVGRQHFTAIREGKTPPWGPRRL
jgi:enoyl-CoA hydratase/carnithine racemase